MKNVGLEATYFNINMTGVKDVGDAQEALKAELGQDTTSVSINRRGNVCCMGTRVFPQVEIREKLAKCGLNFIGSYDNTSYIA